MTELTREQEAVVAELAETAPSVRVTSLGGGCIIAEAGAWLTEELFVARGARRIVNSDGNTYDADFDVLVELRMALAELLASAPTAVLAREGFDLAQIGEAVIGLQNNAVPGPQAFAAGLLVGMRYERRIKDAAGSVGA